MMTEFVDSGDSFEKTMVWMTVSGTGVTNQTVATISGNGNGGCPVSTGNQTATIPLGSLSPGTYTVTIGGLNNLKTFNNETSTVLIDDVVVTAQQEGYQ